MIPNIITIIRILGIIPLTISILNKGIYNTWQLIAFILIITTDFLDGYIARKYNQITNLGKILDPIVDKLLVIAVTIAFLIKGIIPVYSLFIYIRDLLVMIGAYYIMFKQKKVLGSDIWGKTKTVLHFFALALVFIFKSWNIYSLILLIIGLITIIPEAIFAYKTYIKK